YGPKPLGEVDFIPPGADHLAGSPSSQNCELQRSSGSAFLLTQLGHEGPDLGKGQCGMMLDAADLCALRQQVFQMPAPPRRVLTRAEGARCRPIEDRLDAAADPARRLGLLAPD